MVMKVCGIDIGGTKMELAVYAEQGAVSYRRRVPTLHDNYDLFLQGIHQLIVDTEKEHGPLDGVGLGMPGIVDRGTGTWISSNVPAINGRHVANDLQRLLQRDVAIGNDCQLFALSEANGGSGAGKHSVFGAIVGTGAGGGLCVGGKLLQTYNSLAGEWGHLSLPARLQQQYDLPLYECGCGMRGCIERYVSGPALSALYRKISGAQLDAPEIVQRMRDGEPDASEAFKVLVDVLGYGLAAVILVADPHVIVLGGGLSQLDELYAQLPTAVGRHLFASSSVPPILRPTFGEAGGTRGAALLAGNLVDPEQLAAEWGIAQGIAAVTPPAGESRSFSDADRDAGRVRHE